jgi:predicted ester cyclase
VLFPSLNRLSTLTGVERAAYNKFVADGLIDITATYDQSGLAAAPTETYGGVRHRVMEALTALFHNTERFNREVMAMSAFRTAMDKRASYSDKQKAFAEAIAEAKDVTNRAMFDYSSTNKPRFFQHPVARIVLQFKQFPQQMTFFLAHNFVNMIRGQSPEVRREATARFVGTMGMAAAFSGATGLWGFSTLAAIVNAVMNGLDDRDEPFDFELEFVNWAVSTFGQNMGTLLTRGIGNAAGVDLASRVKLDSMWFRDSRNNQDEVAALQSFLIEQLGPSVGLVVNVAEAAKCGTQGMLTVPSR